jgi:hypothetical protein
MIQENIKPRYVDDDNNKFGCGCGRMFKTSATLKYHVTSSHNGIPPVSNKNNIYGNHNFPNYTNNN